jgi:hypothetical protein
MNTGITSAPSSLLSHGYYIPQSVYNTARSGRVLSYKCFALNGRTQTEINADINTNIIGKTFPDDIIVLWEGTNDMFVNSLSGADAYANLITYARAVKSIGAKLVVSTVIARNWATDPPDMMTRIGDYNTLVRANPQEFSVICDQAADSHFDNILDTADTNYYLTDMLHQALGGQNLTISLLGPSVALAL